jgi:predicted transcriptional regulator
VAAVAGGELDQAVALLGPLEGRIMRAVWTGQVPAVFVVRDVHALMPGLAYTTVMTTLRRLAGKGLLAARAEEGRKAHQYRAAGTPAGFLAAASAREAADVVDRYGEAALAAFAARLAGLTPEQRRRLEELQG